MIVYETADGQLWTHEALFTQTVSDRRKGWDAATQGPWETNQYPFFADWLIEALYAGVVKEREVND